MMTPLAIVTFATNTGEFYERLCSMARAECGIPTWQSFIRNTVLPKYRRQFPEEHSGASNVTVTTAAYDLKEYYTRHIAEGTTADGAEKEAANALYADRPHMTVKQLREMLDRLGEGHDNKLVKVWLPGSYINLAPTSFLRHNAVCVEGNIQPGSVLS